MKLQVVSNFNLANNKATNCFRAQTSQDWNYKLILILNNRKWSYKLFSTWNESGMKPLLWLPFLWSCTSCLPYYFSPWLDAMPTWEFLLCWVGQEKANHWQPLSSCSCLSSVERTELQSPQCWPGTWLHDNYFSLEANGSRETFFMQEIQEVDNRRQYFN